MTTTTPTQETIGTITVPAGVIHDASYETAAWYRTFEHDEQTVPIRRWRNFMLWTVEGRTTHEHFPSLWGGVPTGGGTMGDCDKPSTYTFQVYDYAVAAMAERGEIELAEGYRIAESFCDHYVTCMGYVTRYNPMSYEACEHEFHLDAHGNPTKTERNVRGFLDFGYVPGVRNRKRHIKIVRDTDQGEQQ